MILYTVPFVSVLLIVTLLLSFWSIHKHREEQIAELMETGRAIANHIEKNINGSDNPLLSPFVVSNKDSITFKLIKLNRNDKPGENPLINTPSEQYLIKDTDSGRVFDYRKAIRTPEKSVSILSVEIPMTISDMVHKEKISRDIMSFFIIGLISVLFVSFATWRLSKRISSGIDKEMEETRLRALIELAGATAHEMRQPLAIIIGFADLLKDKVENSENVNEELKIIKEQCLRMDDIIKKMLNITHYKTIEYTDGVRILDLHSQQLTRRN